MSSLPPLPGSTAKIHAHRALVLAPHFDDEVIGCGGLVLDLVASGAEVRVLFLSDGGGEELGADRHGYVAQRRAEGEAAAVILGIEPIQCLDLRDGALNQQRDALADGIRAAIQDFKPDLLLAPSPTERSSDHRAVFSGLQQVLSDPELDLEAEPRILLYEVNHALFPDVLVSVEAHVQQLEAAMACYESQLERFDYWQAALGRRQFRAHTLPPGTGAVEAYRQLELADFRTRGASALWRILGAAVPVREAAGGDSDGPLVSVIVRTKDRPELLAEALASLAESHYRRLEVVLVNDGGDLPLSPADDFPFPLELVDLQPGRGRAGAANAGLEAASGEYVAFLDDDDRVEPEHYSTLVSLVSAAGVRIAYTDAAVVVFELSGEQSGGWKERERRLTYSRDFDPDLLLLDNYIPFHTLLIDAELAREVGPLDPDLPFFEDWDWLIRLAQKVPFHHLARVTCEYRQFRGGGHHVLGDGGRERGDFLEMKARIIERHRELASPERLARTVDTLRAETVAAHEESSRLLAELKDQVEAFHRLNGSLRASEDRRRQLEALDERSEVEKAQLRAELDERSSTVQGLERQVAELHAFQGQQGADLQAAYDEIARLGRQIEAMQSTRAWRLHEKLQRVRKP